MIYKIRLSLIVLRIIHLYTLKPCISIDKVYEDGKIELSGNNEMNKVIKNINLY